MNDNEEWGEIEPVESADEFGEIEPVGNENEKTAEPVKSTLMERLAKQDLDGDVDDKDDMDELAGIANSAGLADWQVKRIRAESKTPEEMRAALAYVAGNRAGGANGGEKPEGAGLRSVPRTIVNTAGKMAVGFLNLVGTVAGGVDEDARHAYMEDDPMAKREGESFDDWLGRVDIDPKVRRQAERNPAVRENLEKYFRWEAPIAGKEGMRQGHSLMVQNGREGTDVGNAIIRDAKRLRNWLDEKTPVGNSGNAAVDWLEGAASGIAQFAYMGPAMIATSAAESYQNTRGTALESGKTGESAERLAKGGALFDGALTAAFYYAPFRRWMNGKGIVPVQPVEKFTFSGLSKAMGRFNAKREFLNQGTAALEAGALMGTQAAGDTVLRQFARGQDVDLGEITVEGAKGALDGVAIGAIMGAGRILNARIKGARDYENVVRAAAQSPDGRLMLARLNPDGMMDLKRFIQEGMDVAKGQAKPAADFEAGMDGRAARGRAPAPDWKPTEATAERFRDLCDRAGLPADAKLATDVLFDGKVSQFLGDTLNARFRNAANARPEHAAIPEKPTTDAETGLEAPPADVPPSQPLAARVRREFGVEPVEFNLPQTSDGKPALTPMKWRDNRTGQENTSNLAHDPGTGVTILEEPDGTFSVHNETGDSDGAATIGEAVEKAKELALMGQYTALDRERKRAVIEEERAAKYGRKNVAYFNTMAEAAEACERAIRRGEPIFGVTDAKQLRDPAVQDRDAFITADGTTAVILDNVHEVGDIPRILGHEIVGHGGPNGEFGGKANAQVVFAENIRAKEFEDFKRQIVEGNLGFVHSRSLDGVNRELGEAFAHYASANLDKEPSTLDRLVNKVNDAARKLKIRRTYSSADVKTMMAKWRDAARGEGGQSLDLAGGSPRFDFFPVEKPASNPQASADEPRPASAGKPVTERNIVEKLTDKAEAREIPLSEVEVSDIRIPQFKENADPATGEVEPLTGEPYDLVSNPIVVMEFKDGRKVVVTGRHRYGLYKRAGRKTIAARVIREADGWTVNDAKAIDAIGNIIDEKGTVKDYVRYFDEAKPSREEARSSGFLDRAKGQRAFGIFEGATSDTRQLIDWEGTGEDGRISVDQAGIIAEAAPKDAHPRFGAVQRILTQKAANGLRGKKLGILARTMAEEVRSRRETPKADGSMQLDLFTSEEDLALMAAEERRADYRAKKANEYGRMAENLRTALRKGGKLDLNKGYAKELGITNPKNREQIAAARDRAVERANYWENAVRLDDADKAAMDAELGLAPKPEPTADNKPTTKSVDKTVRTEPTAKNAESTTRNEKVERATNAIAGEIRKTPGHENDSPEIYRRSADRIVKAVENKDAETLREMMEPMNKGYRKGFAEVTGIQLPLTQKGTREAIDRLCGITPERRAEIEAGKNAKLRKEWDAKNREHQIEDGRQVVEQHKVKTFDGDITTLDKLIEQGWSLERHKVGAVEQPRVIAPDRRSFYKVPKGAWEYLATIRPVPKTGTVEKKTEPVSEPVHEPAPETASKPSARASSEKAKPAPTPRTPSIRMKDAVAEKLAQKQEDDLAVLFDTPELGLDSTTLSGDEVRKTMPGYNRLDWSTHVDRTGFVGPRLEAQFQRLLKERKGKGDGTVVFLAGGNGAGKSTFAARIENTPDFTIDSTLGNLDVAKRQIDAILANGQTPVIHFVYRNPGDALEGIKQRVKHGGHIVSPLSFANSHVKSRENLRFLSDAYGDRIEIHIYDGSVDGAPEITLEQLEQKRKPDHAKLREEANFYLGHLRRIETAGADRAGRAGGGEAEGGSGENARIGREGARPARADGADRGGAEGGTGGGNGGEAREIAFDTPEFDADLFQKRVGAVAKLVKTYRESGVADFGTLATRMAERFPEKFGAMKPYLRGVWNAVADQMELPDVSRGAAELVYAKIEAQAKEAENGLGEHGDNGGVRTPAAGGEQSGGILAGGRVRPENADGRVGSLGTGAVPRQVHGVAEDVASGAGADGAGEAVGGTKSVADRPGHEMGEREARGDSAADGARPSANVKIEKRAGKASDRTKVNPPRRDFAMTKAVEDAIVEKSAAKRIRNNLDAIKLVRDLKARDYAATPQEQETLAKFVGWGGLREKVFGFELERAYQLERAGDVQGAKETLRRTGASREAYELHKDLRQTLNDGEYESARESASTAFYTPVRFVRILHDALRNLGVKGGRFLGPSAGVGNFASAAGAYEKPVNWQFVEKDVFTGEMLKALFPNQRVTVGGFEETKFPDGFFDFAIDNVPYADIPVSDRSLSSRMFKLHDYFFAKTLAKLRSGGVMAFLTSTGTLDKTSPILRQFLTQNGGRIVGAVRLPNGFFAENAGTDAASDLVVVQKVNGRPDNAAFEKGVEYGKTEEWVRRKGRVAKPLSYNGYFQDHPEQVVGEMSVVSGQFGPTLRYTMPGKSAADMWNDVRAAVGRALDGVDRDALLKNATVAEVRNHAPVYDEEGLRQGNVAMKDGRPFIKSGDMLEPISLPNDRALSKELAKRSKSPKDIMDGVLSLRKAMRDVIDAQMRDGVTDADLAPLLAKLNEVYDGFVKRNGSLHDKWVSPFVLLDKADGNRLLALERIVKDADGKPSIVKSDIFSKRVISRGQKATKADTPRDALVVSYSEMGGISVQRIAELLGVDADRAVEMLKAGGDAFENPQTGRLEPSWEYLSGRVRAKLAAARAAVESGEESYRANIEALEKVQPPMVRLEDAEIKFGATWVDQECMKDFLRDAFGADNMQIDLGKNNVTGQWNLDFGRVLNEDPWGETSWSPREFVGRVLNHGSMNHYVVDPIDKKRYLDERRTEANKLAAEKLHHSFSQFIQSSEKWANPCYERYNAVMTDMVEIKLPNNILSFRAAGMSESALGKLFEGGDPAKPKKGREYQSSVIARGVLGGGSLCLAHCVGAGKTLEMQSIGVLGRHLGLFKKPMYVVPNHMLEQFTNEFVEAFPNANILKMGEDDVKPANRRAFFAQVSNGDWDAIVVKHSTFSKKLAMSGEYQKEFIEAQRRDLVDAIAAMKEAGERISVDQTTKKLERLEAKLEQLANAENHDSQIVPFEELGVDQLFVDEAHNFKGMPITTRQGRTGGLSQGDSQRAVDMQMKAQYVQSLHGGDRGVVFATGTPLSNAPVVEAYVMLKYLAPNKLQEQGLGHFDDFVSAFGRITTESEFSLDGKSVKEKEKVSAFVNIPELMKLLRSVVDIVNPDQLNIPRPRPKYHMIDVDMTPAQEKIMEMVAREASTPPSRKDRNKYLTLTRIAKNACLTPRLLGYEDGGNKIIRAVAEIKKVYDETADNRGAQLVFTDIFNESLASGQWADTAMTTGFGTTLDGRHEVFGVLPKRGSGTYNLNEEIRDLLVQAGVPRDEIAIIQDVDKSKGDKDANKGALFAKVRSGEVRVLIGSRPKMGEGTNVQERLAAIHLLHPGWKPAEDEQAIGRIIRFGNTYKEGQIFYYLTKGNASIGSYETKNHQLIGVKSKLIDQVMHGDDTVREIDMDESAMDRDMLMGLASGNKALMELIDVKKRVHKLELNTESTASSARRIKDRAEANARVLERRREEFAAGQKGAEEWREKNDGKPFTLSTPDGRAIEKVKDMAEYVSAQTVKILTQDRYARPERTVLGDFNGVELVLAFDKWGDEKFRLAVPLIGVAREINYSGFIPDFSQAAMTAFKGKILETVSPDFARAYENSLADMDRQAKKMSADANKLQKDYEGMRGELVKLRTRQAELERAVTPLIVQTVEDRRIAAYGNWIIQKPAGSEEYAAQRETDAKRLSAKTVKELLPLMDAADFASPKMSATKTVDIRPHLKPNRKGEFPNVDTVPASQVDFDTPELTPRTSVTVPSGPFTTMQLDSTLRALSGKEMPNDATGMTAQINAVQRRKIESNAAVRKSEANGFSRDEHNAVASVIESLWRIAEPAATHSEGSGAPGVTIRRFVSIAHVGEKEAFPYLTVKQTVVEGARIYSIELEKIETLEGTLKDRGLSSSSVGGIVARLRAKVNGEPSGISERFDSSNPDVSFDTPNLTPAEQAYGEAEDKTPTEKVMREVYGMTNEEIATALKAAGMEPPKHVRKPDETAWKQAEALLSNTSYMEKLSRAVAKFPRNIADYENNALNVLFRQRQTAVNAAQASVDRIKETLDAIDAVQKEARDAEWTESRKATAKDYAAERANLAKAKSLMFETGLALTRSSSEAGRRLRSNRGLIDQTDHSYAGISGEVAAIVGGADKITPEMDAKIREIARDFANLDEVGRDLATERLKAHAEKIVEQIKNGGRIRKAAERGPGDEAKRVMRNYNDALAQIEVGSAEVGGTLVGLSDQQYPAWGKWLRAIGEFHCFENPDITEEECVRAIVEDISPFMDGVDDNQVRDALTGFGHNFRQSRYEAQRLMNDLRSQARLKRQMDWMDDTNTMPPLTGMVRDEPSDTTRNLQKQVQERKKEVPDAGRDARRLKGVLESAKTRVRNRIADMERAIATGERIPGRERTVAEDIELRALRQRRDELQKTYDELFKTERGMTDEQRVKLAERLLSRELGHALEDLDRARAGDFSKRPKRPSPEAPSLTVLRDRLAEVREQMRELKRAKYEFGMTPEELSAYNARRMANREKAVARLAERIVTGDIRPQKKPQPPMPPEMQDRYDELGRQMNRAHRKLADLRREAADARKPKFVRFVFDAYRFIDGVWKSATASLDFTQVGNQTGTILMAHPKLVARNFARTLSAFRSQTDAENIELDLLSEPSVKEAVDNGWLKWRRISDADGRGERVELFDAIDRPFTIGGKTVRLTDIPVYGTAVENSDRLYATYINAASASLYSTIVNDLKLFPGGATVFQKKMLCDMVNVMNGSGTLSKDVRRQLGKVFWAPGLVDSQLKRLLGYQIWHPWTAPSEEDGSGTFGERARMSRIGLGEFVRANLGALLLGGMLFALFATDDQKDEYARAGAVKKLQMLVAPRVRHTQLDFTGGSVAFLRLGGRLASGAYETATGRTVKMRDAFGEVAHFAKGRLTPLVGNAFSALSGKDYAGQDYGAAELLLSFAPISISDAGRSIYENGIQDRAWATAFLGATLTMFGVGKGTYRRDDYRILSNRFLESKKEFDAIDGDDILDEKTRSLLLADISASNPLMRDDVREDIAADIAQIRKDEARVRKDEKKGYDPDESLLAEIEREKAALIEKIRSSRSR
ncbi:MAG: zeta toxin family protein [Kiritimatiellia bacterium]